MKNKIDLINDCFSMLLRTGVTVNASPDDNVLALNRLEDMMAELESRNLATGYNFEDSPEPDSPSGLENWMNLAISQMLAMRVWPDFSPEEVNPMLARNSAQSSANLSARLAQQNALKYARRTPLGSGNQPYQQYNKFFGDYGSTCGPSDVSSGGCAPVPTPPPFQCSCDVIPLSHLKLLGDEALFGASEKQYSVTGFYDGSTAGGGLFVFNPDGDKSTHNGVTVYAPEALQAWAGTQADIATLLNWTGVGSGVWVRADLRGFVTPEMAGAVGDDPTVSNSMSIYSAIRSYRRVFFDGVYYCGNLNPSATNWDNRYAVLIDVDSVELLGSPSSKLVLLNNSDCHVIKVGLRAGTSLPVHGITIDGVNIDGNRANQVTPDPIDNHHNGIDVSTGCTNVSVSNLSITGAAYYGLAFQRDGFKNCKVENLVITNTGADGVDFKGDSDNNTGNSISNVDVSNYGHLTGLTSDSAAFDLRSGVYASGLTCSAPAAAGKFGIRLQNGTPGATPVQPTIVDGFSVSGSSLSSSTGVRLISRSAKVSNGKASGFTDGYSLSDPDNRISNIEALNNEVGIRLWQNAGAGVEADTAYISGVVARNNSQAGIVYDSVDEISVIGADVRGNGIGHDVRAGCSNIRIIAGSCTGNTTNLSDLGSETVVSNVSGVKTATTVSTSVDIASTGTKSFSIAHGLPVTPSVADINLCLVRNTNVGDWSAGFLWITSTDATNINGQLRVLTASATGGAVATVQALVRAKRS